MVPVNLIGIRNTVRILVTTNGTCVKWLKKNLSTVEEPYTLKKKKIIHPYRKIHPWKSVEEFSDYLLENVLYNEDGLVAINKPYGISSKPARNEEERPNSLAHRAMTQVANSVDYTLSDAVPAIAKALNYPSLTIAKSPERYMSGIALLAANEKVQNRIQKAWLRTTSLQVLPTTYWIVTTKLPKDMSGKMRVAIAWEQSPDGKLKKPNIIHSWSTGQQKRNEIQVLHVEFKLLANSTGNYSSLIELQMSTRKWHAIRLFAATVLHSPVLGDNLYGSRVQQIMGTWLNVSPFAPGTELPPKLNKHLLELLYLTPAKQELIPAHIHLRKLRLLQFLNLKKDLEIEAPLLPPFDWTCEQLMFKNILSMSKRSEDKNDKS